MYVLVLHLLDKESIPFECRLKNILALVRVILLPVVLDKLVHHLDELVNQVQRLGGQKLTIVHRLLYTVHDLILNVAHAVLLDQLLQLVHL